MRFRKRSSGLVAAGGGEPALIRHAIKKGINFFDTANMYSQGSSEEILGRALRDFADRDDIVIATKPRHPMRSGSNGKGLSGKAIMTEIDHSPHRLGTDHVDLPQIHRNDHDTPLEETFEALHDIVKAGKVRYLGASSMRASGSFQRLCACGRQTAGRASYPCRIITIFLSVRSNAKYCLCARIKGWARSSGDRVRANGLLDPGRRRKRRRVPAGIPLPRCSTPNEPPRATGRSSTRSARLPRRGACRAHRSLSPGRGAIRL